mgnify:FL=1
MKTIGFFGDSFCASNQPESWCNILQQKLGARRIRWFGEPGRSVWNTMIKFNRLIDTNQVPDISIFCWTEPYRLYHPKLILTANTEPLEGVDPKIYKALEDYWKYFQNYEKDEMTYEYALKYYDQHILSKVDSQIVQMWSFKPFETNNKDAGIKLQTGVVIDESLMSFSKEGKDDSLRIRGIVNECDVGINHMTIAQNQEWANKVYEQITK